MNLSDLFTLQFNTTEHQTSEQTEKLIFLLSYNSPHIKAELYELKLLNSHFTRLNVNNFKNSHYLCTAIVYEWELNQVRI